MAVGKTLIILLPLVCAIVWYEIVHEKVPEPYLVRQLSNHV